MKEQNHLVSIGLLGKFSIVSNSSSSYNPSVPTNFNIGLMHNLDHSSVVCCVKFSNDGKSLATGCNRSAQIYDVETGEKIQLGCEKIFRNPLVLLLRMKAPTEIFIFALFVLVPTISSWLLVLKIKLLRYYFFGYFLLIYLRFGILNAKYYVTNLLDMN